MKQFIHRFRIRYAVIIILLSAVTGRNAVYGQTCCQTNSVNISTGYDPVAGSLVATGCDGCPPAPDPKWKVAYYTPGVTAAAPVSGASGYTLVSFGAAADVVNTWGIAGFTSNAISCMNSADYHTDLTGPTGTVYYMDLTREIDLCAADSVIINLDISSDNGVDVYLDPPGSPAYSIGAAPSLFTLNPGAGFVYANWTAFNSFIDTVYLSAGSHTLYIRVYQYNHLVGDHVDPNASYLNVEGSVTSRGGNTLISEGTGCSPSWAYCTEPGITGPNLCCVGDSKTLSNSFTGGSWSSSAGSVATISLTTGTYSGASAGTAVITYTDLCGRTATYPVTIEPNPAITAGLGVCAGYTSTLNATPTGGTWSGGGTDATIDVGTGVVTGIYAGTAPVTYTLPTGCYTISTIYIEPLPSAITGVFNVCVGGSTYLSDGGGGTWSSSNTNATVGSTVSLLTGINAGTATITYTLPTACYTTQVVTVDNTPAAIDGPAVVCAGATITLADSTPGGSWTSSNAGATVGPATGIVTGAAGGAVIISYTLPDGCYKTKTITVNPTPDGITGTMAICAGTTTTLSSYSGGGVWSSSGGGLCTVGSASGVVSGVTPCTATITYAFGTGCSVSAVVTVYVTPAAIGGTLAVCAGSTTALIDATTPGTWSSSAALTMTVGSLSGLVNAVSADTATITYTLTADGCTATAVVTVNPLPGTITGATTVCAGGTSSLGDTAGGGSWSSSNITVATVGSATGVVTGVGAGTATITYTLPTGCLATTMVTVNPSPGPIGGSATLCSGTTISVSDDSSGTWSIASTLIATILPGTSGCAITGISAGNTAITLTNGYGCYAARPVFVAVLPITGANNMCAYGSTETVTDGTPGGAWTSSLVTMGTYPGVVTSAGAGTAFIYYTMPEGCADTVMLTIYPLPDPITGSLLVCGTGGTTTLGDPSTGGVWSSAHTPIATVGSATGIVTGVTAGTDSIIYTLPTGCIQAKTVTVNPTLSAIGGTAVVCVGATTTLDATPTGGVWSATAGSGSVTVGSTGVVTGATAGTATVSYSLLGCDVTTTVTVNAVPAAITGTLAMCQGATTTLSETTGGGNWSAAAGSGSATVGSATGVVTGLGAGTATIIYTIGATGCTATATVNVNDTTGSCTPCEVFTHRAYTRLGSTGSISTATLSGYYYIANNVAITGTVNVTDAVVFMASGITVSVNPTAELIFNGSHVLGGCAMWNGIVLRNDGISHTGRVVFQADGSGVATLIEDAITAATVISPVGSATDLVTCNNVVFNRNNTGLDIENDTSLNTHFPFLVRNSVFTSRDFTGYPGYPYAWPQTMGTGGLKTYYDPGYVFIPPFNIITYTGVACKNGAGAANGITLKNIGWYTAPYTTIGPPIPNYYSEIVIGDTTQVSGNESQNLFDNLNYGIFATNSNVTLVNNVFMNLWRHLGAWPSALLGGEGVYANETNVNTYHDRLRVYSPNGNPYHNLFYEFYTGVECDNYFQVLGLNSYMINEGPGTLTAPSGMYGWLVKTGQYDTVIVNNDTISNVANGIAFWSMNDPVAGPGTYTQYEGALFINGNVIQASPLGYTLDMTQNVSLAISVQNTLVSTVITPWSGPGINEINQNVLNDVERGIYVNNITRGTLITTLNSITLRPTAAHTLYYGVNHTLCHGSAINSNYIMTSGGTAGSDSMRAIYMASTMGSNISCNVESNTGRGFEFFLQNHGTAWHDNNMTSNGKGYVLNGATVGTQHYDGRPMNNQWLGSTWSSSNPQTYVYHGANAIQDTIFVSTAPLYNGGSPSFDLYSIIHGSIQIEAPDLDYDPCPTTDDPNNNHAIRAAERIARKQIIYADNTIANNWTAQYEVWKSIVAYPSLVDSSLVIAEFDSMAVRSRYKYLTDLDSTIASGDFTDATVMLGYNIDSMANSEIDSTQDVQMADGTAADYIVENYQAFYSLYMLYIDSALTSSDSLQVMALAQLCPEVNGNVVYQARALYSEIYNDLSGSFNDDSCLDVDSSYIAERHSNPAPAVQTHDGSVQQYTLIPNPTNGNITLHQAIQDVQPVRAEIWNAEGVNIFKDNLTFTGGTDQLYIANPVPGLYLLRLTDDKGREFILKFVIE